MSILGAVPHMSRVLRLRRCKFTAWISGTRLEMNGANCLNVPVQVNGLGFVSIGAGNSFGYSLAPMIGNGNILIQARTIVARVTIGDGNLTSNNISIVANASIRIGNRCQIGDLVAIYDSDFHEISPVTRNMSAGECSPVNIGNNVWLGSRVVVLKGVTIGDNSVVGAMSLVTKSIPPNVVAAGAPAKVIRPIE